MSSPSLASADFQVVDLESVRAAELESFFHLETAQWRDHLLWDVSGAVSAFQRALERGAVQGKAIRSGSATLGYSYFIVEGDRGVLTGLSVSPEAWGTDVGPMLVRATVRALAGRRVSRIETQFVSFDAAWLVPYFEAEGFRTHWREFRRLSLSRPRSTVPSPSSIGSLSSHSWRAWNLAEAAQVMQSAHQDGVDAEMNELYRTSEGCRLLLTNVLRHRGCGTSMAEASLVARQARTDRAVGFAVVTETSKRQAHLAQLAVAPSFQGKGVGRYLLAQVVDRLLQSKFDSLSLMVSRGNENALRLYRSFGFHPIVRFPVFSRERSGRRRSVFT
jgi:[ribosomal protein S18]-alanine N-acetyltransferase